MWCVWGTTATGYEGQYMYNNIFFTDKGSKLSKHYIQMYKINSIKNHDMYTFGMITTFIIHTAFDDQLSSECLS